jgi:hypothetical protein
MNADMWVTFFICWGAFFATAFVLGYPLSSEGWRKTWIGWGLLTSSTALALLLGLAVAGMVFGDNYLARPYARLTVTFLVAAGATLKVVALFSAKVRAAMSSRRDS